MIILDDLHKLNTTLRENNSRPIGYNMHPYSTNIPNMLQGCMRASDWEDDSAYIEGFVRTMSTWGGVQ